MVNIVVNGHICEIQIAHQQMLVARKGLAGHTVFNRVRNVMELLDMTLWVEGIPTEGCLRAFVENLMGHWWPLIVSSTQRGSTDVVNLPIFQRGTLEAPMLKNWYEDDVPLSEWEGITTGKDDARNKVSWQQQSVLAFVAGP
jgi:hypothetical protein